MSKTTLEIPKVLMTRIKRGLTPATSQGWVVEAEDPANALTRAIGEWFTELGQNDGLFKKHVYDNDSLNDLDMRQHCGRICGLVSDGQHLILDIMTWAHTQGEDAMQEAKPIIKAIDQKIKKLTDELFAWHAPLDSQTDIPESFKQAAREVKEGKLEDLDL